MTDVFVLLPGGLVSGIVKRKCTSAIGPITKVKAKPLPQITQGARIMSHARFLGDAMYCLESLFILHMYMQEKTNAP